MRSGMIAAVAAGFVVIGTAGYFANEWWACRSLRQDYRTFAMETILDQQLANAARDPKLDEVIRKKADAAVMRAGQTLFDLERRCGKHEAVEAQLEATQIVLGQPTY